MLAQGMSAKQVIEQGHKAGTVFKVQRQLAREHASAQFPSSGPVETDGAIERDPEVVELKKQVRKAQLERQLRQEQAPCDLENRVANLEAECRDHEKLVLEMSEIVGAQSVDLSNYSLRALHDSFACPCGNVGHVAIRVECTSCGEGSRWGWSATERG